MNYTKIRDLVTEHRNIEEAIRLELINIFDEMPDNDEIERIHSNPSCFKVSSATAFRCCNLLPEFYDFPQQWQRLQKILRNGEDFATQLKTLEKIAETGRMRYTENRQPRTFEFNPHVIDRLRVMLRDSSAGVV